MAQLGVCAKVGARYSQLNATFEFLMEHRGREQFQTDVVRGCPHAASCPGCGLLHLDYPAQLAHKAAQVRDALQLYPSLRDVAVAAAVSPDQLTGYRTRAKLVSRDRALGLYARGTHRLVDIPHCRVLDPLVARTIASLRTLVPDQLELQGVDVGRAGGELLVTLICGENAQEGLARELALALQRQVPEVVGVSFTRREAEAVQLLSGGHVLLAGIGELCTETVPYHYVAFGAFQQAHEQTARAIYQQLAERTFACTAQPRVLELYAGSGALSLSLAAQGAQVTAVESYAPACERLSRAAHEQKLAVRVRQGDAARELQALLRDGEHFDLVLVNPPRRGLELNVRRLLGQLAPESVGYVSCKPTTLARDLAHLRQLGFRAKSATPFDMMPMTDQVETVAWLERAEPPAAAPVQQNEECWLLEKAPHAALDPIEGHPVNASAETSSGLVLVAKRAEHAAALAKGTRVEWSALVRGVVRARGTLRSGRYTRRRIVSGHSLVAVEAATEADVLRGFRAIGHPVIGEAKSDRATAKYFFMRHGLDRPFVHAQRISLPEGGTFESGLAPDLAAVLSSLERSGLAQTVEEDAQHGP